MKRAARTFAERGVRLIEASLSKTPPSGVSTSKLAEFFRRHGAQLTAELEAQLDALHSASKEVKAPCGCSHADKAQRTSREKRKKP